MLRKRYSCANDQLTEEFSNDNSYLGTFFSWLEFSISLSLLLFFFFLRGKEGLGVREANFGRGAVGGNGKKEKWAKE